MSFLSRWRSLPNTCLQTSQSSHSTREGLGGNFRHKQRGSGATKSAPGWQPPAAASGGAWPPGTASAAHAPATPGGKRPQELESVTCQNLNVSSTTRGLAARSYFYSPHVWRLHGTRASVTKEEQGVVKGSARRCWPAGTVPAAHAPKAPCGKLMWSQLGFMISTAPPCSPAVRDAC